MTNIPDFPSNSRENRSPEPEKKAEKPSLRLIEGGATLRKKPLGTRLKLVFLNGDITTTIEHVVTQVIIPAIRDTIVDAVKSGVDDIVYGGNRSTQRRQTRFTTPSPPRTNYNGYSSQRRDDYRRSQNSMSFQARKTHDFDEIVFPERQTALAALDQLKDYIEAVGHATVADLYGMVGVPFHAVDTNYGWTDLEQARTRAVRDGIILILPPTEELNRDR